MTPPPYPSIVMQYTICKTAKPIQLPYICHQVVQKTETSRKFCKEVSLPTSKTTWSRRDVV